MQKLWTRQEFASLIDCLRRHSRVQDAANDHNAQWKTGRSINSIEHKLKSEGLGSPGNFLRLAVSRKEDIPAPEQVKRLVEVLKKKAQSVNDVCDALDLSPRRLASLVKLAIDLDYRVEMPTDDHIALNVKAPPIDRLAVHRIPIDPVVGHLRFAVASDLHFASKLHRGECLADFIDFAYGEHGVRVVLVPGDIVAGVNMYPGQPNEVTGWGLEHQKEKAVIDTCISNGLYCGLEAWNAPTRQPGATRIETPASHRIV